MDFASELAPRFPRELLTDVVRSPGDVEDELGVKCLGVLPDIGPDRSDSSQAGGIEPKWHSGLVAVALRSGSPIF